MKSRILFFLLLLVSTTANADWASYYAYSEASQIAVAADEVYAVASGSLFSVNKISEKIRKYDVQTGLHATGVVNIFYDTQNEQLLIFYGTGKIDVMDRRGVEYISGLYTKDFTYDRCVYNVTEKDGIAYLSTSFGIVTFDLKLRVLVDTYFIAPNAKPVAVNDVVFAHDSIYAFTKDYLARASMQDNIVDYRVWQIDSTFSGITRDKDKGIRYVESNGEVWTAGKSEGIVREMSTGERLSYKPDGPALNTPVYMFYAGRRLYIVAGGRWATQNNTPGQVIIFDGKKWKHITQKDIESVTGKNALDFMNVAVDPNDKTHYFVTSYGTGLYEFKDDKVIKHYLPGVDGCTLEDASGVNPYLYTRCDGAICDKEGNLYVLNSGTNTGELVIRTSDGKWGNLNLYVDGKYVKGVTQSHLIIDNRNPQCKLHIGERGNNMGLIAIDDRGTLLDNSDDRSVLIKEWVDQDGNKLTFEKYLVLFQGSTGTLWIGTQNGVVIIPSSVDVFESNQCQRLRLPGNEEYLLDNEEINAIAEDDKGNIWIGSAVSGVYVLSPDGKTLVAHHTTENSTMPSNSALSLAWDNDHRIMYIGTAEGLVATGEGVVMGIGKENEDQDADVEEGNMLRWKLHPSYGKMQQVVVTPQGVYGLANGSLFIIDADEEIQYMSKLTGLHGSEIIHIDYNEATQQLMAVYANGMIDLIGKKDIKYMIDLYQKAASMAVTVQDISMRNEMAYLAMPFGIVQLNLKKHEVADTYYIGQEGSDVDVKHIACTNDTLYAVSDERLYYAPLTSNLKDYANWQSIALTDTIGALAVWQNRVYSLEKGNIYQRNGLTKELLYLDAKVKSMKVSNGKWLIDMEGSGIQSLQADGTHQKVSTLPLVDMDYQSETGTYWGAMSGKGVIRLSDSQSFVPNGPITNDAYKLKFIGERLFVCPGGRWASEYGRSASLSYYENGLWNGWDEAYIKEKVGVGYWTDVVSVAASKKDPSSYFVGSYGVSLIQFMHDNPYCFYHEGNSTLISATEGAMYIRVDGMTCDEEDNLWVLNAGNRAKPINIRTATGQWYAYDIYSQGSRITLNTPGEIQIDRRDSRYKWLFDQRGSAGIIFHFDNGTPTRGTDDKAVKRSVLYDQDNSQISLDNIYAVVQDRQNDIWVGTDAGIVVIPASVDFLTQNTCRRIKISRNDGTNLADYLLGTELIHCIAVDGGNRKWIGTEGSGLYLVSEDGQETIYHFTENNSPLPSNTILSVAIHPVSGEVFIGTDKGIASFLSDASEPSESYDNIYAYPNPVRRNYEGVITIKGLVENSYVTIIDGGGNLVCKTRSMGGTAVWDGKLPNGQRAATGIYTVLCNGGDGKSHTVTKILFVN